MPPPAVAGVFRGKSDDGTSLELEWHHAWNRVTSNPSGVTGWATILATSSSTYEVGSKIRIHKCAHVPCTARHPASKYGAYAPPIHVRELPPDEGAFEAGDRSLDTTASAPAAQPPATLEASSTEGASGPFATAGAGITTEACAAGDSAIEPAVAATGGEDAENVEVGASLGGLVAMPPTGTALRSVAAALPQLSESTYAVAASPAVVPVPARAAANIIDVLMSLARELRSPRRYVGYSFFSLTRPCEEMPPFRVGRFKPSQSGGCLCTMGKRVVLPSLLR